MAVDVSNWVPVQYGGELVRMYKDTSAVEAASSRREPMNTETKYVPKDTGADVSFKDKGATYTADTQAADRILLDAAKLTYRGDFYEEDLSDSTTFTSVFRNKQSSATANLARLFDNATLAVTAAGDGSETKPYTSVYSAVKSVSSSPGLFKITDADSTGSGDRGRLALLDAVAYAENSVWSDTDLCIIAHPAFRTSFRQLQADGAVGVAMYNLPGGGQAQREEILGYPIFWSRAARLSATATSAPTAGTGAAGALGNAICAIGPRNQLIIGDRAPLEQMFIDSRTGIGALSDTAYLKMRRRAAFVLGAAESFAVVERTTS